MPGPTVIIKQAAPVISRGGSSSREAIQLYRDILKGCKGFHWCDKDGVPWSQKLKESARREFEEAREEKDPLIQARLLVVGRQCLENTLKKIEEANGAVASRVEQTRSRR
jgi:hypothetical protein